MTTTTQTTQTYKPTLLQKLLGRNYKWWYISLLGFKSNTTYRYNSLAWLFSSVVMVFGTLIVWYINYSQYNQVGVLDSSFKEIFTYLVVGEGCIFASMIQFDIGENIQDGKFTTKLLIPTSYLKYYIVYQFGYQFFENISKFIIYLSLGLILSQFLILPSFAAFLGFGLAVIIAYSINILIGIIIGGTAFFLTAFFGSAGLFDSLKIILGGKLFPLDKLRILQPLIFSPFAFTFYHPMQIYLGKYNSTETLLVFAGGITWCIILYFLAKFVFKKGLKRNEAVGL
jgi:ABC-2 type transport system permease protein